MLADIIQYPEHAAIHSSLGTKFEPQTALFTGTRIWPMSEYVEHCFEAYRAVTGLARQPTPCFASGM
jgi:hypothetical protein